ncbi:MAG TPA: hypothetical protein VGS58_04760 [Candidatus Sulfopaludibacter sp.]|nr:hypothetical protein [Candidatus Sulfopaludibacter sp.]
MDISSIALTGIQNAQDRFDRAAAGVTRAAAGADDTVQLSQSAVELLAAKNQFGVAIQVTHVAGEMQKSLLNLLA